MHDHQSFDEAITKPKHDLLGMEAYAKKLAKYLERFETPFTLGIYGEWGDGKTSFVNLLKHYLDQAAKDSHEKLPIFICFSAWPHTTADELWRALIIRIADRLYKKELRQDRKRIRATGKSTSTGLIHQLGHFLKQDIIPLHQPPPSEGSLDHYNELVRKLDRTSYGSVTKSTEQHLQINQQMALLALVKAGVTALGLLSPLAAGLRGFLNLGQINLTGVVEEKNQTTRETIKSVQEFRQTFTNLVQRKVEPGKRIFIFIDDLDRCMPDVALDILEGIRNFLDEVPCVFIVAADEQLIGQGLSLRYKDLYTTVEGEQVRTFLAQKGREYFEKVTQLGIRVPPRTADQVRAFISAQFSEWLMAADIIQAAVGTNPRRLKQHCSLLSYHYSVLSPPQSDSPDPQQIELRQRVQLCDKLLALHALYAQETGQSNPMQELIQHPAKYLKTMSCLEKTLSAQSNSNAASPEDPDCGDFYHTLHKLAQDMPPLLKLFREWSPCFTKADEAQIAACLPLVDAAPASQPIEAMLVASDPVLLRALVKVRERRGASAQELLGEGKTRLQQLQAQTRGEELYEALKKLANTTSSSEWTKQLQAVEDWLDKATERSQIETTRVKQAAEFVGLLKGIEEELASQEKKMMEVKAAANVNQPSPGPTTPEPSNGPPSDQTPPPPEASAEAITLEAQVAALRTCLEWLSTPPGLSTISREEFLYFSGVMGEQDLLDHLKFRLEAARHFLDMRIFAKLYALDSKWPELGRLLRYHPEAFERWEHDFQEQTSLNPTPPHPSLDQGSWNRIQSDAVLIEFLPLGPYFYQIPLEERRKFFAVSHAVVRPTEVAATAAPAGTPVVAPVTPPTPPSTTEASPAMPSPIVERPLWRNLIVHFKPLEAANGRYHVELIPPPPDGEMQYDITLDVSRLTQAPMFQPPRMPTVVDDLGLQLYQQSFEAAAQELLIKALAIPNTRLALQLHPADEQLNRLSWEALYIPQHEHPALKPNLSMVRYLPVDRQSHWLPPPPRVRVLAVLCDPGEPFALQVDQEVEAIKRELNHEWIELRLLTGPDATEAGLRKILRTWPPHLFHFTGQSKPLPEQKDVEMWLEDGKTLHLTDLQHFLQSSQELRLAVLNTPAAFDLAFGLLELGAAGVIATAFPTGIDDAHPRFIRAFYESMARGVFLDGAVYRARQAVAERKRDWSVYTLFTRDPQLLDKLTLLPEQRLDAGMAGSGTAKIPT